MCSSAIPVIPVDVVHWLTPRTGTKRKRTIHASRSPPLTLSIMPSLSEKTDVLPQTNIEHAQLPASTNKRSLSWRVLAAVLGTWLLFRLCTVPSYHQHGHKHHHDTPSAACEQADPVLPQAFNVSALVPGNEVRIREWLMGAVRVPTEVFDVMGEIGEDPRWDVFYDFSACKCASAPGASA